MRVDHVDFLRFQLGLLVSLRHLILSLLRINLLGHIIKTRLWIRALAIAANTLTPPVDK